MVESFGGVLNLVIWLLLIVAGGYYAYRCLLQTKGFIDQYGFGDGAVFMTRLVGTCVGASTAVAIVLLFVGPQELGHSWCMDGYRHFLPQYLVILP